MNVELLEDRSVPSAATPQVAAPPATLLAYATAVAPSYSVSLSVSPGTAKAGQNVTMTATVTSPAGTPKGSVTFRDGDTVLGTAAVNAWGRAYFSTASLAPGAHPLTASFGGVISAAGTLTVTGTVTTPTTTPTTTTLTASAAAVTAGQAVTFTASVQGGSPAGSVTFRDNGVLLGQATLSGGSATLPAVLAAGSHSVTAEFAGQGSLLGSTSPAVNVTVQAATGSAVSVALAATPNPAKAGQNVTMTATVTSPAGTPKGSVTFRDGDTVLGTAAVNAWGRAYFSTASLAPGAHPLTASFGGVISAAGTLTVTGTVTTPTTTPTTTTLTASAAAVTAGQAVTFTASVQGGSPAGSVTFRDNGVLLGQATLSGGSATLPAVLAAGSHSVTAEFAGQGSLLGSTSPAVNVTVQAATGSAVSVALAATPNPAKAGQNVTMTATVTSPAGTPKGSVTFRDGDTVLGTAAVNAWGNAYFSSASLSVGTHPVTASFAGTGGFGTGTSTAAQLVVTAPINAVLTTTTLTATPNPVTVSSPIRLSATVRSTAGVAVTLGSVTFKAGTAVLGTVNVGSAGEAGLSVTTLPVGQHSVVAVYNGSGAIQTSTSAATQVVVSNPVVAGPTTTTLTFSVNPAALYQPVTLTATVRPVAGSATPTGTVRFVTTSNVTLGSAALNAQGQAVVTVSTLAVGSHEVRAYYDGGGTFTASASPAGTMVVTKGTVNVQLTADPSPSQPGQPFTLTAQVTPVHGTLAPGGTVTFRENGAVVGSAAVDGRGRATFTVPGRVEGSYAYRAEYGGSATYATAAADLSHAVRYAGPANDDVYEDNDTRTAAADLGGLHVTRVVKELQLRDGADWFRFRMLNPSYDGAVVVTYNRAEAAVSVELTDANGNRLRLATGTNGVARVSLANLPAATYFVRVFGGPNSAYELTVEPMPFRDDNLEENDTFETAYTIPVTSGVHWTISKGDWHALGLVMSDAADWYRFRQPGPGRDGDYVEVAFDASKGDIDLELYDAKGNILGASSGPGATERLSLDGVPAGWVYVKAFGAGGTAHPSYSMRVIPGRAFEDKYGGTLADLGTVRTTTTFSDLALLGYEDTFTFTLHNTDAPQDRFVEIRFDGSMGDLNLAVSGPGFSKSSATAGDSERVSLPAVRGTYTVRISGANGATNGSYALTVAPNEDDANENNDTMAQAKDLGLKVDTPFTIGDTVGLIGGMRLNDGEDWFKFTTGSKARAEDYVQLVPSPAYSDWQVSLHDATGRSVGQAVATNPRRIALEGLAAGTYYVRVWGTPDNPDATYNLEIDPPYDADDLLEDTETLGTPRTFNLSPGNEFGYHLYLADAGDYFRFEPSRAGFQRLRVEARLMENVPGVMLTAGGKSIALTTEFAGIDIGGITSPDPLTGGAVLLPERLDVSVTSAGDPAYPVPYILTIREAANDALEDNPLFMFATPLGTLSAMRDVFNLKVSLEDQDFFRFTTTKVGVEGLDFVSATAVAGFYPSSSLTVSLYTANGDFLGSGVGKVSMGGRAAGTYNAVVSSKYTIPYSLRVTAGAGDDPFESNDTRATAADLGALTATRTVTGLRLLGNDDWFRVSVTRPGHRFLVTSTNGSAVAVEAYDANGSRITYSGNTQRAAYVFNTFGDIFIRVSDPVGSPHVAYELTCEVLPEVLPIADDPAEDNDTQAAAYDLGLIRVPTPVGSFKLADAADWFRFQIATVPVTYSRVEVTLSGPVNLSLYAADGTHLQTSKVGGGTDTTAAVALAGFAPGEYFIRVWTDPAYEVLVWGRSYNLFFAVR